MICKKIAFLFLALVSLSSHAFAGFVVTGSLIKNKTVTSGESYQVAVHLKHSGTQAEKLKLYLTDFFFDYRGKFYYPEPGKLPRSNAKWIKLQSQDVNLAPDEKEKTILLTVQVPNDSTLKGTYWSSLMIEGIGKDKQATANKMLIHTHIRYSVQIISDMVNEGKNLIKFHSPKLISLKDSTKSVQLILSNAGDHQLSPTLSIQLFNQQNGASSKKTVLKPHELLPGTSKIYQLPISKFVVKGQKYIAVIIADGGNDNLFGMQYPIQF